MTTLLRLNQVDKRFGTGTLALQGLTLDIQEARFTSLLGPSGCGKSTVLRLIAGLTAPSAGVIERPSAKASSLAGDREAVSFVFQDATLMPWARVADNVSLPLRLKHVPAAEIRQRVDEVLALVGLQSCARAFPRELSGGMKMRVSIARALITRPRLLLMDEPFAALDEITRLRLNQDLLALTQRHALSVVFVTHSVYEAVFLSQRIVVMAAQPGRIVADIDIAVPGERDEDFRNSAVYGDWCRRVSQALNAQAPHV